MGHKDDRTLGTAQSVDPVRNHSEGVDVQAGVGLVENCELGLEHRHLKNLVALLLAAGEAFVDRTIHKCLVHLEQLHLPAHYVEEVHRIELVEPTMLPDRVESCSEKIHVA